MKNYVIINGVNSLTITGLAISKLPSISKPPLRVMTEEINGRDGDLITDLGYGAYDKELVIGLYGNYDINEVIGFFNQEGTIVFSNEDDKYYNFKIINQIDYEALIKFRTATISLHCQPFKYPLTETPEEITTEYVEDEGETLTLNDTKIAPLSIDLKGNTSQNGTPTPSSPIPVNVVSGDNEVDIVGKNLYKGSKGWTGTWVNTDEWLDDTQTYNGLAVKKRYNSWRGLYKEINVERGKTYTFSFYAKSDTARQISIYLTGGTGGMTPQSNSFTTTTDWVRYSITFNVLNTGTIRARVENTSDSSTNATYVCGYQLEEGNLTEYEAPQFYTLYLGVDNLLDITKLVNGYWYTNGVLTSNQNWSYVNQKIQVLPNTAYTLSRSKSSTTPSQFSIEEFASDGTFVKHNALYQGVGIHSYTITTQPTTAYVYCQWNNTHTYTDLQFEIGSKASTYSEYGVPPIELNKIGTYQDYIYKDSGKWYLHKEVGKYQFKASDNWYGPIYYNSNQNIRWNKDPQVLGIDIKYDELIYCNLLTYAIPSQATSTGNDNLIVSNSGWAVSITYGGATDRATMNSTFENKGMYFYYVLNTPTEEEITNTTLINQLETLKGAMSYEGQTNISQVNNDLPFILKVKGTKEGSGEGIINNIGNIYAKPIIELEGTGNIGIYKNGTQYFEVDMSSDNEITIDTEKMEAYHNGVLKNRQVIGDYNKFTIDEGNNNIEITGELTKATISNYTRWL